MNLFHLSQVTSSYLHVIPWPRVKYQSSPNLLKRSIWMGHKDILSSVINRLKINI